VLIQLASSPVDALTGEVGTRIDLLNWHDLPGVGRPPSADLGLVASRRKRAISLALFTCKED